MNGKVYIHEFIDILGHARAKYMHHMTANWSPIAQAERKQLCFGVWGAVGSTGRWPEVVNMWEENGWSGLASNLAFETGHPGLQDPELAQWWAEAAKFRRGGIDRIVVPAAWSPTIDELCARGVRGVFVAHELVKLKPGSAPRFLELVREVGLPTYETFGFQLVGAFRTAMRNDSEAILLWAIPKAEAWAAFESAWTDSKADPRLVAWRGAIADVVIDWERILLVDAPLSPMRTGRQPQPEDRRPLDEI